MVSKAFGACGVVWGGLVALAEMVSGARRVSGDGVQSLGDGK